MTVIELAKALNAYIGQGGGKHEVCVFQWDHGSQPLTDVLPREGTDTLELYSNTDWRPEDCPNNGKWQETLNYGSAPAAEDDDLLGVPVTEELDELI